jgi:hypothetical protein
MRRLNVFTCLLLVAGCSRQEPEVTKSLSPESEAARPSPFGPDFWQVWGDDRAEVAAYELTVQRNNRKQPGMAVLTFATERFSASLQAKVESAHPGTRGVYPAMKLNVIRDYQTGLIDDREMSTVFATLAPVGERPAGAVTKVTHSNQDLYGHQWLQMLMGTDRIEVTMQGDGAPAGDTQRFLPYPQPGIPEEALPLCARRIAWPRLRLGQTYDVEVLSSFERWRRDQAPQSWSRVKLSLSSDRHTANTPLGSFRTHRFTAEWENGERWIWYVEGDSPFRIVRWESSRGETGELLGADRMKPQEMNTLPREEVLRRPGWTPRRLPVP